MYLCVSSHVSVFLGIQFCHCFYDFSIRFWCGILYFGGAPTVWYFLFWRSSDSVVFFILEEFRQCGIFYFGGIPTVLFFILEEFRQCAIFILEEFRQCGIFYFEGVPTVWYFLFFI